MVWGTGEGHHNMCEKNTTCVKKHASHEWSGAQVRGATTCVKKHNMCEKTQHVKTTCKP